MSLALITKDRRFWPLFWSQFLGAANDNFFKNALVILITYNSVNLLGLGASSLVAAAGGVFILPYVLFSATAGQLADRYDKSDVIKVTKVTELLVMILATIGFVTSSYELLFLVLFLMGAQSTFFGPVKYGCLPEVLTKQELTLGNAFIAGGTFIAILIGTILGGISASLENAVLVTSLGIITTSLVGIFTAWKQNKLKGINTSIKVDYTVIGPTYKILKATMKEKNVMMAIMGVSWFWFFGASVLSILPSLVKDLFHGSEVVGTIFLSTFTFGMGLGAYLCNKFSGRRVEVGMVPLAAIVMSFFAFIMSGVAGSFVTTSTDLLGPADFFKQTGSVAALFSLFMITVAGGMFIIPQQAFMQKHARPEFLARTIAANNIWNAVGMVSAAILLMVLHSYSVGIPDILTVIAVLNLVYALIVYMFYREEMWRFFFHAICTAGYNIEVVGSENLPETGPIILASNHVSFVDWLFIMSISPRPIRWVIDHRYYFIPGLKQFFQQGKLIPIAPKKESETVMRDAFIKMDEALADDRCLGIFPEGYITRHGGIRKFQPGIKKIVDSTKANVVPIIINGAWGSYFSHHGGVFKGISLLGKRNIKITILPSISAEEFCYKNLEDTISGVYISPNEEDKND